MITTKEQIGVPHGCLWIKGIRGVRVSNGVGAYVCAHAGVFVCVCVCVLIMQQSAAR